MLTSIILGLALGTFVLGQQSNIPNTWPHAWPGQPRGDFSPKWQKCEGLSSFNLFLLNSCNRLDFEVTHPLPNITHRLPHVPRNFAGNIPVNRAGHPNDTLFFWGFESKPGSLTRPAHERTEDPWIIWLQGG